MCVLCVYEIKEKLKPSHKRCLSIVVRRLYFLLFVVSWIKPRALHTLDEQSITELPRPGFNFRYWPVVEKRKELWTCSDF